jgi:hypothetical protein
VDIYLKRASGYFIKGNVTTEQHKMEFESNSPTPAVVNVTPFKGYPIEIVPKWVMQAYSDYQKEGTFARKSHEGQLKLYGLIPRKDRKKRLDIVEQEKRRERKRSYDRQRWRLRSAPLKEAKERLKNAKARQAEPLKNQPERPNIIISEEPKSIEI